MASLFPLALCPRVDGFPKNQPARVFRRSAREAMMKKVILGMPRYRQRFVLEIVRHEGGSEPLFEITRCLAVGGFWAGTRWTKTG